MTLLYVTLTGTLPSGAAASYTLKPSGWLTDPADELLLPPAPLTGRVGGTPGGQGTFTQPGLLQTDASGPVPAGWTWSANFTGLPGVADLNFSFLLPAGPWAFTATYSSPCVFAATGTPSSALANGTVVELSGGALPGGFAAATPYYVVGLSGGVFSLAATAGGSPIASTSAGSGQVTVTQVDVSTVAQVGPASPMAAFLTGTYPGGTTEFLRADGQWEVPAGGEGGGAVNSVNGQTGTVILNAAEVGADAAGAAATAQSTAESFATAAVAVEAARAETAEALKAPLASPALTGSPTAPTQTAGDSTTKIATDAFVAAAVAVEATRAEAAEALLAPLANAALTGAPTAPAPTTSSGVANKAYVDAVSQGLDTKPSALVVATANLALSGLQTIDGFTVPSGGRVLATAQTTASQDGLWVAAAGAWSRPTDYATGSSQQGAFVFIEGGTAGGGSGWVLTGTSPVVVDTGAESWTQFSGGGVVLAGAGLAKVGNTLSIAASPALTGNPTAPTQATGDNSTRLATTAFASAAVTAASVGYTFAASGDPTGATDQATITALENLGTKIIYFPPGTVWVTGLTKQASTIWQGAGRYETVIELAAGSNADVVQGAGFASLTLSGSTAGIGGWGIRDLTINGNKASQSGTSWGLRVYGYNFDLTNVSIINTLTGDLYTEWGDYGAPGLDSAMEARYYGLKLSGSSGYGWRNRGPHDSRAWDVTIFSNGAGFPNYWAETDAGVSATVAAGSNGAAVSSFAGSGTLNVSTTLGYPAASISSTQGSLTVTTSTGQAVITYTGTTATSFTGCTTVSGTGTLSTGAAVNPTGIGYSANGCLLFGVHNYGAAASYQFLLDAQQHLTDCIAEVAATASTLVRANYCQILGGQIFIVPGASQTGAGLQLGDTVNGAFGEYIRTWISGYACTSAATAGLNVVNDVGQNDVEASIYAASGSTLWAGTLGVSTSYRIRALGQATAANAANSLWHDRGLAIFNVPAAKGSAYTITQSGTDLFNINTSNSRIEFVNGYLTRWYSDNYATVSAFINGATGAASLASLAMNAGKITGLANGSAATDGAAFGQLPSAATPLPLAQGGTGLSETTAAALLAALGATQAANNLSDLLSAAAARTNLGLGSAALLPSSAFDAAGTATAAVATETTRAEGAEALLAPLANAALTGAPTAPTPTTASGIANKSYVDSVAQGLDSKPSAEVVATANLTLSGTQTIDGVAVAAGARVLATGQSTASQNGLWTVAAGAWSRPTDFATGSAQLGAFVFVEGGTIGASSGWTLTGTASVTVDTTSQTWTQFSGAGEILAGSGLAKSGNTLSIATSPALAGTPTSPTASPLTSTTQIASTAYADAAVAVEKTRGLAAEALLAPSASPTFTGTPAGPTAAPGTNTTQVATTAFTTGAVATETSRAQAAEALLAPLASPVLTGTPAAPTRPALTSSTALATTAYADAAVGVETTRAEAAEAARLPLTGGSLTGGLSVAGALITPPATLTDASSIAVNAALSNAFRVTLGGNRTLANPSGPADGQTLCFEIIQDGTGSRTLAYGSAYSFPSSIGTPVLSTSAGFHDFLVFRYDAGATTWYCVGFAPQQGATSPFTVSQGGTGLSSLAAWELLAGGTTSSGAVQQVGTGTSGQVLTSNGAGALPSFQAASSGFSNPMTTAGDIIIENATPAAARLAVGSGSQFLGVSAGLPAWAALPAGSASQAGTLQLDGTAADIQALGTQAAGSAGKAADAGHIHPAPGFWMPSDNGLLAATDQLAPASASTAPVAGTLYLVKLPARAALTVTNIWFVISTAGSGSSTGSYIGLYSSTGTLLSGSSDIGTQLTTSAVSREIALTTAQTLGAGAFAWIALLTNLASSQPTIRAQNYGTVLPNINLAAASYRIATNGTALTSLPPTITPSSNAGGSALGFWFGVS
jgi:hypothetical protein